MGSVKSRRVGRGWMGLLEALPSVGASFLWFSGSGISALRRDGTAKGLRHIGTPLAYAAKPDRVVTGGGAGVQLIAVGPVLVNVPPRIAPIVEHLAAQEVSTDSPFRCPVPRREEFAPRVDVINVAHFPGEVIEA